MDYKIYEKRIINIVDVLPKEFPIQDRNNVLEFNEHGEWGLALEVLCTQLYEYSVPISQIIFEEIKEVCIMIGIKSDYWERLKELVIS